MPKDLLRKIGKIFFLLVVLLVTINILVIGQETQQLLPRMWVCKKWSLEREKQFTKPALFSASKCKRLTKVIGKDETESINYPIESFNKLIEKLKESRYQNLHIYFASYDLTYNKEGFTDLPDKTLTMIFAPADGGEEPKDIGKYYFIRASDGAVLEIINPETKNGWIAHYENKKMPELVKTIKRFRSASENRSGRISGAKISDTKALTYRKEDIEETFVTEVTYQYKVCHTIASGIQVNFSAYTRKGRPPLEEDKDKYKKRLIIQFEYIRKNILSGKDEVFYIDDQCNFEERLAYTKKVKEESKASKNKDIRIRGFNHGDLCPPKICN